MTSDDAEACLQEREVLAWVRLRNAADALKDALIAAGDRSVREHPWALPSAGFCAGFLVSYLLSDRRPEETAGGEG